MRFVVLSSSRGTTLQAILDAIKEGALTAECVGLITDREDRGCIEKAKAAGLPYVVVEKGVGESREEYDQRLDESLHSFGNVDVIAAMGWMFVLSPPFIRRWKNRILNVHPALLPRHGGRGMYGRKVHQAVLDAGERESGMTIHIMDEGVDSGRILLQKTCIVDGEETIESLKEKVQALEKEWYPKVLRMIMEGEIDVGV